MLFRVQQDPSPVATLDKNHGTVAYGYPTMVVAYRSGIAQFPVDPMHDPRAHYKQLYRLAKFQLGQVVYCNDRMCEVVKRYYRISEQRVLYDLRDARTNDVRTGLTEPELMTALEHHAEG